MSTFSEYVTGTSFAISLSRRQIDMLCQLDQYDFTYGFLSTCGALIAKGLVERRFDEKEGRVVLTEAGKAIIPLLKLSGLYVTYPPIPSAADLPDIEIDVKLKGEVPA